MIEMRKANDRGHFDHGWLDSYHTFSFAGYRDPKHTRFRALRVMNEDRISPGGGFGMHPHDNMEIVTYVLEGALEHQDSMGNGEVLRPGEFQRMSARTGLTHSEFNPSKTDPVHLYQIWLFPERQGLEPSYEQRAFPPAERSGQWRLVASRDAKDGSLLIQSDVDILLALAAPGEELTYRIPSGRHVWLQVLRGQATLNELQLAAGDGIAMSSENQLTLQAQENAELLLFDLA